MSKFTGEEQLLIYCSRAAIAPLEQRPAIALSLKVEIETSIAQNPIDWQRLIDLAQSHRVIPLIYRSLHDLVVTNAGRNNTTEFMQPEKEANRLHECRLASSQSDRYLCANLVPPEIIQQLTEHTKNQTIQSLHLTRELINVLKLLESANITAVPFKGACLSLLAYGNLGDRDFSDLDILLHRADVLKSVEILSHNRYRDRYNFTPAEQAKRWKRHHEWDLIKENGLATLDLHWAFTERQIYFPLDLTALEPRLERLTSMGTDFLTFSAADTLLILGVNGSKEFWCRLLRICDVAALVYRHPAIDWEELLQNATRLGSRRMVLLGLILAREVMGTVLPEVVLNAIERDTQAQLLAKEIQERLFDRLYRPLGQVEMVRYYLKMRERWRDRLWYLYHYFKYSGGLTPSLRDIGAISLPKELSFLYYFVRVVRVLAKYGLKIVKERSLN